MSRRSSDSYSDALAQAAMRIIDGVVQEAESGREDLLSTAQEVLTREAPQGMPLDWVMYIKSVASKLGDEEEETGRKALLKRVGAALVDAIDEGEVTEV
ncbi:MAG: hypothetical protein FJ320_02795 [SAR202 cluster bacterium]|nr:hypothetical protein [SAR202 cluster bacterium]